MARPGYEDIPPGAPAPAGAVEMQEVFFSADGRAATGPMPGGSVSISFWGPDGELLQTVHGEMGEDAAERPTGRVIESERL